MIIFPAITIRRNATEQQAIERLIDAATDIVKYARWVSLSNSKVDELRAPLLEIRRARRK